MAPGKPDHDCVGGAQPETGAPKAQLTHLASHRINASMTAPRQPRTTGVAPKLANLARVGTLFGARVGGTALSFGHMLLLFAVAEEAVVGQVIGGMAVMFMGALFFSANIEAGAIRYVVRYGSNNEWALVSGFLRLAYTIVIGVSALASLSIVAALATGWLDWGSTADRVLILTVAGMSLVACTRILVEFATAFDAVTFGALPVSLGFPACLLGTLAVYSALGAPIAADWLMGLVVLSYAIAAIWQYLLVRPSYTQAETARPVFHDWREWLGVGAFLAPTIALNANLKQLLIAAAGLGLGAAHLAEFGLALSILGLLLFAMIAVNMANSYAISRALQDGDGYLVNEILGQVAGLKLAALVAGGILTITFGEWVLSLIGDGQEAAYVPMIALLLLPAAEAVFGQAMLILRVTDTNSDVFWSSTFGIVTVVAGTALGGLWGGVLGASLGCGIAFAATRGLQSVLCIRLTGFDPTVAGLVQRALAR